MGCRRRCWTSVADVAVQVVEILVDLLRRQRGGRDDRLRPDVELVPVGEGHPEQLTDHLDRQRSGEVLDQVDRRPGRHHGIDQLVGDLPGPGPELLDPTGGERLGDQPPQPGVLRRIHRQDAALDLPRSQPRLVPADAGRPTEPRVTEDHPHIGIPGGEPRLLAERQPHPDERLHAPQLGVEGVEVEPVGGAERVRPCGDPGDVCHWPTSEADRITHITSQMIGSQ